MKKKIFSIPLGILIIFGLTISQAFGALPPRVTWEYSIPSSEKAYLGSLTLTDEGNILAVQNSFQDPKVIELDVNGKIIWEYGPIQANSARFLKNGNILITDSGAPGKPLKPQVIEVSRDGEVLWAFPLTNRGESPRDAKELANGNILIVVTDGVIEVNRKGKIVWQYRGLLYPNWAERLSTGNTLIVDRGFYGGKVLEVEPNGKTIWEYGSYGVPGNWGELSRPVWAKRLPTGETLISDRGFAVLLKVKGEKVEIVEQWLDVVRSLPTQDLWAALPDLDREEILLSNTLSGGRSVIWRVERGIKVYLRGKPYQLQVPPSLFDSELYGGAREIMNLVGATVNWKPETKELEVISETKRAVVKIDETEGIVDGEKVSLSPPKMLGNTTMLPLEFIREFFGLDYHWDGKEKKLDFRF